MNAARDLRSALESAHCIEEFSMVVHGATAPDGTLAVIVGVFPPDANGWTFPLPITEARRIAALLIEVADAKSRTTAYYSDRCGKLVKKDGIYASCQLPIGHDGPCSLFTLPRAAAVPPPSGEAGP